MEESPRSKTVRRGDEPTGHLGTPLQPHLFLVLECLRPSAAGARFSLAEIDDVVIGRASRRVAQRAGRTLRIGVPDPMMSSTHARIVRALGRWIIRDAGSTNGTFCDAGRVSSATLEDGALVELGGSLFTIRTLPTPAETPLDVDAPDAGLGMDTLLPGYASALAHLQSIMRSTLPILLLGESGTGKEVLARAVHQLSRRPGAFVPVNCGAIPEALVEGQLFGHTRGAFSGAVRDEPGFVRASDGGTLFLDEIGDLPGPSQAALLRVLQESEVLSVGTTRAVKVDLRVVSATHRRIDAESSAPAGFRRDMYARLAGYVHELPPLRDRREDLGILVAALLRALAPASATEMRIAPELGRALYFHPWPLNVRELQHALAAALVFAKDRGVLEVAHAPEAIRRAGPLRSSSPPPVRAPSAAPLDEEEARLRASLEAALRSHAGNVSEVARSMGKTRMQIHRWMRKFGIDPREHRRAET